MLVLVISRLSCNFAMLTQCHVVVVVVAVDSVIVISLFAFVNLVNS